MSEHLLMGVDDVEDAEPLIVRTDGETVMLSLPLGVSEIRVDRCELRAALATDALAGKDRP